MAVPSVVHWCLILDGEHPLKCLYHEGHQWGKNHAQASENFDMLKGGSEVTKGSSWWWFLYLNPDPLIP